MANQTTVRNEAKKPSFSITDDRLWRVKITAKAKAIHSFIAGKPSDWTVNIQHIINTFEEEESAVYSAIRELIDVGLWRRVRKRTEGGQFGPVEYIVSGVGDLPKSAFRAKQATSGFSRRGSSTSGSPTSGSSTSGKSRTKNKKYTSKSVTSKKVSKQEARAKPEPPPLPDAPEPPPTDDEKDACLPEGCETVDDARGEALEALLQRGVHATVADDLVRSHSWRTIVANVVLFDSDPRDLEPAWLVSAVKMDFAADRAASAESAEQTTGLVTYDQMVNQVSSSGLTTDDFAPKQMPGGEVMWRRLGE